MSGAVRDAMCMGGGVRYSKKREDLRGIRPRRGEHIWGRLEVLFSCTGNISLLNYRASEEQGDRERVRGGACVRL